MRYSQFVIGEFSKNSELFLGKRATKNTKANPIGAHEFSDSEVTRENPGRELSVVHSSIANSDSWLVSSSLLGNRKNLGCLRMSIQFGAYLLRQDG
jgi:hypothetical protein